MIIFPFFFLEESCRRRPMRRFGPLQLLVPCVQKANEKDAVVSPNNAWEMQKNLDIHISPYSPFSLRNDFENRDSATKSFLLYFAGLGLKQAKEGREEKEKGGSKIYDLGDEQTVNNSAAAKGQRKPPTKGGAKGENKYKTRHNLVAKAKNVGTNSTEIVPGH